MGVIEYLVKYTLILSNVIGAILGIGIVVIGSIVHFQFRTLQNGSLMEDWPFIISMSTIALGVIVLVVSYTACYGAMKSSKPCLIVFAVLMCTLASAKIGITVGVNQYIAEIKEAAAETINEVTANPDDKTIHIVEFVVQCCGTTGPDSYNTVLPPSELPPTCCENGNLFDETPCIRDNNYNIGCLEALEAFLQRKWDKTRTVLISVIVFEVLEFTAAIYLCTTINKKKPIWT